MEKLDPKAIWILFLRALGTGLILILTVGWFFLYLIATLKSGSLVGIIIPLVVLVIVWILGSYGWAKLSYNAYKFQLVEEVFKKEHGVIWKRYVSIPYAKIQNVDIHRGILARILGLSDLMIQTAGYAGVSSHGYGLLGALARKEPEGKLPGLSKQRAEEIREELIRRTKGVKSEF